jgi:hypothetical protein
MGLKLLPLLFVAVNLGTCWCQMSDRETRFFVEPLEGEWMPFINTDSAEYQQWNVEMEKIMKVWFLSDLMPRKISILVQMNTTGQNSYQMGAFPPIEEKKYNIIFDKLLKLKSLKTNCVEQNILYTLYINGSADVDPNDIVPFIYSPEYIEEKNYKILKIEEKIKWLQNRALKYELPLLKTVLLKFDKESDHNFQHLIDHLETIDFQSSASIKKMIDNPYYWRSLSKIDPRDNVTPLLHIYIALSRGELEYVYKISELLLFFYEKESVSYSMMTKTKKYIDLFIHDFDSYDQEIGRHWKNYQYDSVIFVAKHLLQKFPQSSWTRQEITSVFMELHQDTIGGLERKEWDWNAQKNKIFNLDPFFSMPKQPSTKEEAFQYSIRHEFYTLFSDKEKIKNSIKRIAEICFDIKEYHISALLFYYFATLHASNDQQFAEALGGYLLAAKRSGYLVSSDDLIVEYNYQELINNADIASFSRKANSRAYQYFGNN